MAGNEWINGYLEAILDAGERIDDHRAHDEGSDTCVLASTAAKYFVEEVVGHDDPPCTTRGLRCVSTLLAMSLKLSFIAFMIFA
ncbi:unnamed protein product [Sphagnum jensenii]|uniref:Uncharacterized protein n=1 Tax=Sphagnum jensenii TaxID=128206 RepID=A0ABP0VHK9_9BRYO